MTHGNISAKNEAHLCHLQERSFFGNPPVKKIKKRIYSNNHCHFDGVNL